MKLGTGFTERTAEAVLYPRWTAIPLLNGTATTPARSSESSSTAANDDKPADETPSSIPQPVFTTVDVVPAAEFEATKTSHEPIPQYPTAPGSAASILKGYCTEPAYTILDGPTALWVPVVGCISSKADCCPTSTGGSGAAPTGPNQGDGDQKKAEESGGGGNGAGGGGFAATFPLSSFPAQGTLTGCPKDYHTVGGTACCPSSYWPWSAVIGGQVPCYSSLARALDPPGMPDTLVRGVTGEVQITSGPSTASPTLRAGGSSTSSSKPTSAIVNIAYAMQYSMQPAPKPKMQQSTKIGIGAGVAGAALVISVLAFVLIRRFRGKKTSKTVVHEPPAGVQERFAHGVDKSYVAHEAPSRTYGGVQYAGVSTQGNGHHY